MSRLGWSLVAVLGGAVTVGALVAVVGSGQPGMFVLRWPLGKVPRKTLSGYGAVRDGGRSHQGVDWAAPVGSPVYAPGPGIVEDRSDGATNRNGLKIFNPLGGIAFRWRGDNGWEAYGAHLTSLAPKITQHGFARVEGGELIGYTGQSGNAKGQPAEWAHLHFQLNAPGGIVVNPDSPGIVWA